RLENGVVGAGVHVGMHRLVHVAQNGEAASRKERLHRLVMKDRVILRFVDNHVAYGLGRGCAHDAQAQVQKGRHVFEGQKTLVQAFDSSAADALELRAADVVRQFRVCREPVKQVVVLEKIVVQADSVDVPPALYKLGG